MAGASLVSAFNEMAQVGNLLLDNLITSHAMDPLSRYSILVLVSAKDPLEVWGASAAPLITVFGKPG